MQRRLALVAPTLLGVTLLVFALLHLVPGDPVEIMLGESAQPADVDAMRHSLGLDQPWPQRLGQFLGGLMRGDLGQSIAFRMPVTEIRPGVTISMVEDPDGNWVEFLQASEA